MNKYLLFDWEPYHSCPSDAYRGTFSSNESAIEFWKNQKKESEFSILNLETNEWIHGTLDNKTNTIKFWE